MVEPAAMPDVGLEMIVAEAQNRGILTRVQAERDGDLADIQGSWCGIALYAKQLMGCREIRVL